MPKPGPNDAEADRVGLRCMQHLKACLAQHRNAEGVYAAIDVGGSGPFHHQRSSDVLHLMDALAWGARLPPEAMQEKVRAVFIAKEREVREVPISHAFAINGNACGIHHAMAHKSYHDKLGAALRGLQASGVDVSDGVGRTGKTVLHFLAESASPGLIASLIDLGLDPSQKDARGWSVRSYTKSAGNQEAMAVLDASLARLQLERLRALGQGVTP